MLEALGIAADFEGDDIGADEAPEVVLLVPDDPECVVGAKVK